jgi:uncharacterized protein (DUF58 family)
MSRLQSWYRWLETHWVAPAYGGGVLLGLTIAFLGAATNTMAGWLYVISGVVLALLLVGAWLPPRSLKGLQVQREPIRPVSVGEPLQVTLTLTNPTGQARSLLQLQDPLPAAMGARPTTAIAAIGPRSHHRWRYDLMARQRGIYQWQDVYLRTAAPVGLFWCQRSLAAPAQVTIYPRVWPLSRCPVLDQFRLSTGLRWQQSRLAEQSTEGLTRALRPYRWGDPSRLIHWRTSARYGELRLRELEQLTADNQVLLALDVSPGWDGEDFEAAVSATASLYLYGLQQRLAIAVWMASTGYLQDQHRVLSALAAVMPHTVATPSRLPQQPLVWLSTQPPPSSDSAWLRWGATAAGMGQVCVEMDRDRSLAEQLQSPLPQAVS